MKPRSDALPVHLRQANGPFFSWVLADEGCQEAEVFAYCARKLFMSMIMTMVMSLIRLVRQG